MSNWKFLAYQLRVPASSLRWAFLSLIPFSAIFVISKIIIAGEFSQLLWFVHFLALVGKINLAISVVLFLSTLYFYLKEAKHYSPPKKRLLMGSGLMVTMVSGWCFLQQLKLFSTAKIIIGVTSLTFTGRPLRRKGEMQLSDVRNSKEWLLGRSFGRPNHQWIENAQGEHSSISAFSDLSLKLADLGCPPELLKRAHQAAIDEINHAQLAFTLDAARNDNRAAQGPAARRGLLGDTGHMLRVQKMAVETFTDGCLFEARSAQGLRNMVGEEPDENIRQEIQRTAVEEDSHVELAWKILAWCFREMTQPALRVRLYGQLVKILDRAEAQDGGEMGDILKNARVSLEKIYAAQAA